MDHTINLGMFLKELVKGGLVRNIELEELRSLPTDELNTIKNFIARIVQVVCNDYIVACFEKRKCSKRPNVASSTAALRQSRCYA